MPSIQRSIARARRTFSRRSQLDFVIPPEVINDSFSRAIYSFASQPDVVKVLEIGSSSGAGSTASLVEAMKLKSEKALYCLELSKPRFRELHHRYSDLPWVHCLNLPSVARNSMPGADYVRAFYNDNPNSPICRQPMSEVLRWLQQDIDYVETHDFPTSGIAEAKLHARVEEFDLVLIDGSEFTGEAELGELYGSKYILLDDTRTIKNLANVQRLLKDPSYSLAAEDQSCRNGFSVFKRVSPASLL
jgi:hypothetical protein